MIEISLEEYIRLKQDSETLNLLECGGVDNWSWYGESLNPDGEDYNEIMENIEKDLTNKFK